MRGVKKIAVPTFKNDTLEPRVEVLLANAVIKQIQQDGTYQVAREKDADAILEGRSTRSSAARRAPCAATCCKRANSRSSCASATK